jgi:hypothetical protein
MVGRTRARLARAIAQAIGLPVEPENLWPASGHYRTSPHADVLRWTGFVHEGNLTWTVGSWDTMTALLRHGFTVADNRGKRMSHDRGYADFELHVQEPP